MYDTDVDNFINMSRAEQDELMNSLIPEWKSGIQEMTNPQRVVPSTVVIKGAMLSRLPVKTADTVPKAKIFDIMKAIDEVVVEAPVKMGDVVLADVCGTGVDVVATKSMAAC